MHAFYCDYCIPLSTQSTPFSMFWLEKVSRQCSGHVFVEICSLFRSDSCVECALAGHSLQYYLLSCLFSNLFFSVKTYFCFFSLAKQPIFLFIFLLSSQSITVVSLYILKLKIVDLIPPYPPQSLTDWVGLYPGQRILLGASVARSLMTVHFFLTSATVVSGFFSANCFFSVLTSGFRALLHT